MSILLSDVSPIINMLINIEKLTGKQLLRLRMELSAFKTKYSDVLSEEEQHEVEEWFKIWDKYRHKISEK